MPMTATQRGNDTVVTCDDVFSLKDTLLSGQTFRWRPYEDGFLGIVGQKALYISQTGDEVVLHNCEICEYEDFWQRYFSFDEDYKAMRAHLEYDPNLVKAMEYCGGIRLMRQPLWETVISFIISANNNIPRIMGIIEKLSARFGEKISTPYGDMYTFPTAEALAAADITEIRACGTGYRDDYIKKTAAAFACGDFVGDELCGMDRYSARKRLMSLQGVGAKVADCILLFSVGKEDAFPIDTWVRKVMCSLYLDGQTADSVSVKRIEAVAEERFPRHAGFAQQLLFHYIRNNT